MRLTVTHLSASGPVSDGGGLSGPDRGPSARNRNVAAMMFSALALDYDGAIAVDGVFDPAVRDVADAVTQAIRARDETGPGDMTTLAAAASIEEWR